MSTDVKVPQAHAQTHHPDAKGVKLPIYMDNHATTPMDPRVLEEMLPYFMEKFGNSASRNHSFGWAAEEGVETARERIAKLVGATTKEIIFTSGATESDNLAIKGVAEMYREKGNHIITAVTEHKAVLDTCKRLEKYGYRVTYMPVQKDGLIDLDDLKRAIDDKTILVTIMYANNEIGVLQPVAEIGKLCRERGVIFHTDATQAQNVWAERRWRLVCPPQESASAGFRDHRRRRPRARHALRNAERSRYRRPGQSLRHRTRRNAAGIL
jgi:cysteine desulfurase